MSQKVVLAIANNYVELSNENSAVAAYLKFIKSILDDNYDVNFFNGNDGLKKENIIRKAFSKLSYKIKNRQHIKRLNKISQQITLSDGDLLIEFLEVGSSLYKNHSGPYVIIYDAPAKEKFNTFHKSSAQMDNWIDINEINALKKANHIICYSNSVKRFLTEKKSVLSDKVSILPCINHAKMEEKQEILDDKVNIGFIGSFLPWHKVDLLLKVFVEIAETENVDLYLIGYGMEWTRIKSIVDNLAVKNRVHLTGFVSEKELNKIKNVLTIGVMPGSNWYGSPLKIFEYGALKIPVVAANEPTIRDTFEEDKEILLIDSEDEFNSLKNHLRRLVHQKEDRKLLGEAIHQKIMTKYNKNTYIRTINQIVEKHI